MPGSRRRATHADSWYTGNGKRLDAELTGWLHDVDPRKSESEDFAPPIKGCKAIIAPHAGYAYSGPAAAYAYKSIDTTGIKRVFILGPSHHVYLDGCALTQCTQYETPLGDLPIDTATVDELRKTGKFAEMDLGTDEDEHSIEMHLPYVRKIFANQEITIIPILVGAIDKPKEESFGELLAPYLAEPDTFFVISSDFCHWGTRFSYTFYYPAPPPSSEPPIRLAKAGHAGPSANYPIHASIAALDREAMEHLSCPPSTPAGAHALFADYLQRTKNTICGRHPIGVLLGALAGRTEVDGKHPRIEWVRYEQSSKCLNVRDSSVSYASAYVAY